MRSTSGLTLIELMLALTLSTIILSTLIAVYLSSEKNFQTQNSLSTIQENARTIIQLLKTNIHNAGYIGCAKLKDNFFIKNYADYALNAKNKIVITNNAITIRHMSIEHDYVTATMQDYSTLSVSSAYPFYQNDILLISDCKKAEIFQVKNSYITKQEQIITTTEPLSFFYEKNADVGKLEIKNIFVDKTGRYTNSGKPIYALYIKDINQNRLELVEGVRDLQAQFDDNVRGVDFAFTLISTNSAPINKTWCSYAVLRN